MAIVDKKALLAFTACLLVLSSSAEARKPNDRAAATKPVCEIVAHPETAVKPGQEVKISWQTRNATSAKIDQYSDSVSLQDGKGSLLDRPAKTRTYSMTVTGAEGASASCRVSVAVPERIVPRQWPPAAFAGMPADYLDRARRALAAGIADIKLNHDQRWVSYATASLLFEQDMDAVNEFFATHWRAPRHPVLGFGLFSMDSVRLYGLYNSHAGTFPGRLSAAAQTHMEDEFFQIASHMKMSEYEIANDPSVVWKSRGSENHTFASLSSFFLTAQFLKNSAEFANRPYEDGKTAARHYETWRRFISLMLEERVKRGMFIEVASPTYEDESRQAIQNIRDFAEDPIIRKKAEMVLDVSYALIAQETINGVRGGAKSRVYSFQKSFWGAADDRTYNLLFGPPGYQVLNSPVQATSSYFPPPVIFNLGSDRAEQRGAYEMVQRVPGVGARLTDSTISRDKSVYRYAFATPGYILGSFVLDPGETYVAPSSQNRWQGIVFEGDAGARIAPQVTRTKGKGIDTEQRVHNGFASLQDRNVLITQRARNEDKFHWRTDVYFSDTLDFLEEEGGWIFVREQNSFAAVKVVSRVNQAYQWLDPRTKNKNNDKQKNFITLAEPNAPMIIVASQAADYGNDFDRFKTAIRAQPIHQDNGVLKFATLSFEGGRTIGLRNGKAVDIAPRRVYDSPFMRSDFASGVVYIRKGADTAKLDFSNPDDPIKTIGPSPTADYPDGIGLTKPIVFAPR